MLEIKDTDELIQPGHPLHKVRLYQLAMHLWGLPDDYENFDMSCYNQRTTTRWDHDWGCEVTGSTEILGLESMQIKCNTSACAIGHAPSIFPKVALKLDLIVESNVFYWWSEVCEMILGVVEDDSLYFFLFNEGWDDVDNTPKGAAKRIFFYLMYGEYEIEKYQDLHGRYSEELMDCYQGLSPEYITQEMLEA